MKSASYLRSLAIIAFAALLGNATAQNLYWDTNADEPGSGNAGGFWSTSPFDVNWSTSSDGDVPTVPWTQGSNAVFSAGDDGTGNWTVTVDGSIEAPSITFRDNGQQTISGGTLDIGPAGGLSIISSAVSNAGGNFKTIDSLITGTGDLNIAAHGDMSATGGESNTRLTLANSANTFVGDVVITSGLVGYASNASFGDAANKIILNGGGILDANLSIPLARDIEVQAGGGVIRTFGSVNTTWTGTLTGSGNLRRTDGGTLGLNMDASAFTGTLTNERGTLRLLTND